MHARTRKHTHPHADSLHPCSHTHTNIPERTNPGMHASTHTLEHTLKPTHIHTHPRTHVETYTHTHTYIPWNTRSNVRAYIRYLHAVPSTDKSTHTRL